MWVENGSQLSPSEFGDLIVYVQNEPKPVSCLMRQRNVFAMALYRTGNFDGDMAQVRERTEASQMLVEIEKRIRQGPVPYREFDGGMDQVRERTEASQMLVEIEKRIRQGPVPYREFDGGMDQVR
ncbi:hypothetical protein CDAR_476311 [Caerostris darwini]|uniref:Uncharacterized protein n=1 Tax=Caerostris darwini TaxID=1538125 RepID=A0AAV4TM28_9ARAC|nr:hypothetical protein CDAR_476311 [Caerostris darwini]